MGFYVRGDKTVQLAILLTFSPMWMSLGRMAYPMSSSASGLIASRRGSTHVSERQWGAEGNGAHASSLCLQNQASLVSALSGSPNLRLVSSVSAPKEPPCSCPKCGADWRCRGWCETQTPNRPDDRLSSFPSFHPSSHLSTAPAPALRSVAPQGLLEGTCLTSHAFLLHVP